MKCKYCNEKDAVKYSKYSNGKFCSRKCARGFSTKAKRKEINEKVSKTLTKEPYKKICPICNEMFTTKIKKQIYCSKKCVAIEVNSRDEIKQNWKKIQLKFIENGECELPNSIFEISIRTARKIIRRLEIGCSRCDWNEEIGDIHHINGRKVEDFNGHWNLSYLCPNCHRLATNGKIKKEEIITLEEQVGDTWKEHYYGICRVNSVV